MYKIELFHNEVKWHTFAMTAMNVWFSLTGILWTVTRTLTDQGTPYTTVFNWCILFSRAINEVLSEGNSVNLSNHSEFISVRNLLICLKLLKIIVLLCFSVVF